MNISRKHIINWSLLILFLITVWSIQAIPSWGEGYARHIYPYISGILSAVSSLFPFSLGDVFIAAASVGIIVQLIYILWKRELIRQRLISLIAFCGWIYAWFYLAWGLNYFREDFYTRTQIPYEAYTPENFKVFLSAYTEELNSGYILTNTVNPAEVANEVRKGYERIAGTFGITEPKGNLKAKNMLSSDLMSKMGISGYMGPFFTEFNLNKDLLPTQYPFTYAHEMAHRLSIASEAEANLYAWIVCTGSEIPPIRFSGNLALLGYVAQNASNLLTEEEYQEFIGSVRPEVLTLYRENLDYWRSLYSPLIGKIQNYFYNLFLKGNRVSSGTKNYSEVIGLLMSYQKHQKLS